MAEQQQQAFTPLADIPKVVEDVREGFRSGATRDIAFRIKQLHQVRLLLQENETAVIDALHKDMRKPRLVSYLSEVGTLLKECDYCIDNLHKWVQPEYPRDCDIVYAMDRPQIRREPRGVVLIIGPWNFPIQLILSPLLGALSAGNTVVVKLSEVAVHSSALLASLLAKYFDKSIVQVVQGGVQETTELLKIQFDQILYTGNGHVGRIVMTAAAKFLTPVILELGGKCPAVIADDVDLETTARRVIFGKTFNCGQICVGIDYVLCHESIYERFLEALKEVVIKTFGENPEKSENLGCIVNTNHWDRIMKMIEADKGRTRIIVGGTGVRENRYIAPTILADVTPDCAVMKDEIFGPVLPVLKIKDIKQAIDLINKGDKPLALYVFAKNEAVSETVLRNTSSGGAVVNDSLMHLSVPQLPFGGVGASGMGAYHGWYSFDAFSHRRSMLVKSHGMEFINEVRYPPFDNWKEQAIRFIYSARSRTFFTEFPWLRAGAVAVLASLIYIWAPLLPSIAKLVALLRA